LHRPTQPQIKPKSLQFTLSLQRSAPTQSIKTHWRTEGGQRVRVAPGGTSEGAAFSGKNWKFT